MGTTPLPKHHVIQDFVCPGVNKNKVKPLVCGRGRSPVLYDVSSREVKKSLYYVHLHVPCFRCSNWFSDLRPQASYMATQPPIYAALKVPTVITHPSERCLQWTDDGQLCLTTKSAIYVFVRVLFAWSHSLFLIEHMITLSYSGGSDSWPRN